VEIAAAKNPSGNVVTSPLAFTMAMEMLRLGTGARSKSRIQMNRVLSESASAVLRGNTDDFARVAAHLNRAGSGIRMGSHFFPQIGFKVKKDYLAKLADCFGASAPVPVDFRAGDTARETINGIISNFTKLNPADPKGLIPELFPEGSFDMDNVFAWAAYLAFNRNWATAFDPNLTRLGAEFMGTPGKTIPVAMMRLTANMPYDRDEDGTEVIRLDYGNGENSEGSADSSKVIVLPPPGQDLAEFERSLTPEKLNRWLDTVLRRGDEKMRLVDLSLPRSVMRAAYGSDTLIPLMRDLGIEDVFGGDADLTNLYDKEPGDPNAFVDNLVMETVVETDEQGSRGAAGAGGSGTMESIVESIPFVVNRPALVMDVDHETGIPFILGRLGEPTRVEAQDSPVELRDVVRESSTRTGSAFEYAFSDTHVAWLDKAFSELSENEQFELDELITFNFADFMIKNGIDPSAAQDAIPLIRARLYQEGENPVPIARLIEDGTIAREYAANQDNPNSPVAIAARFWLAVGEEINRVKWEARMSFPE
jgi:serine protease inhibitor